MFLNGIKLSKKGSESENANIAGGKNVDCIFYTEGIIHHEFMPENRL
jgi:hypothetical protein